MGFLHDFFEKPFLSTGDNCWFFFAGHGGQYANRDYLMPQDANPRDVNCNTAIPVSYVRERLIRSGADNVILILDACRTEGDRSSSVGNEPQQGVITISACSPTQKSWEIDELQHGAFTYALHEALQIPGERNCATVERLDQYLRYRVPDLCQQYRKFPEQMPRIAVDPREKSLFILLPQYATLNDIATLKNEAYRLAFVENQIDLAEQLCIRAIAAAMGRDMEALKLYGKLRELRSGTSSPMPSSPNSNPDGSRDSEATPGIQVGGNSSIQYHYYNSDVSPVRQQERARKIPWGWLTGVALSYACVSILLYTYSAPFAIWASAVAGTVAWSIVWSMNGYGATGVAMLGSGAWAIAWAWTSDRAWGITVGIAWAGAGIWVRTWADAGEELLKYFSKFHTFLTLAGTSAFGLGLGLLGGMIARSLGVQI